MLTTISEAEKNLRHRALIGALFHVIPVGMIAALIGFIMLSKVHNGRIILEAAAILLYVVYSATTFWLVLRVRPRVVPYFERKYFRANKPQRVTDESMRVFRRGAGIATDIEKLDETARRLSVAPLSSFGFGDDLFSRDPAWREIDEGLATVDAVTAAVRHPAMAATLDADTVEDLQALGDALRKARKRSTRFALIVRHGPDKFVSGVEMEKRRGSFWF